MSELLAEIEKAGLGLRVGKSRVEKHYFAAVGLNRNRAGHGKGESIEDALRSAYRRYCTGQYDNFNILEDDGCGPHMIGPVVIE